MAQSCSILCETLVNVGTRSLSSFLKKESEIVPGTDTNDTKMETIGETVETAAEVLNVLEPPINTSYNHQL
jgi:hypothetical protein